MQNNIEELIQKHDMILFDEICVLCNGWVKFLLKFDRHSKFKLASVQSVIGQEILQYYGLATDHYDTMLTIYKGQLYTESTAFFKVMQHLGIPFNLLTVGYLIPPVIRNFLYQKIASNRYRIFGQTETCLLPSPKNKHHFLEELTREH